MPSLTYLLSKANSLAFTSAVLVAGIITVPVSAIAQGLPHVSPADVGMDESRLQGIDALVQSGLDEGKMPGCVICFGRHGKIAYQRSFGLRKVAPDPEAMTTDTIFDMASITKPVATATSVMILLEDGQLRLGDKVTKFFPEFGTNGKETITVQDLLIHQSGLIPDNALRDYDEGPEVAWQRICELGLVAPVGTTFKYSDVNFIVLAEIVRQLSGQSVHEFSQARIFQPLGMTESGYVPAAELHPRCAPTEKRNDQWMRGEVHDPRAYRLDGIAGHAGLFSTANDLALYAHMMLGRGTFRQGDRTVRILSPRTFGIMTDAYRVSTGYRGLGWDKQTRFSSNRGDLLSPSAFGHGGFTGTVLWVDPELDLFFIFLSNRVHPDGKGSVNHLAGQIVNLIASSITDADQLVDIPAAHSTLVGLDVVQRDGFRILDGKRVGLITNHTGRDSQGASAVKIFHESDQVDLAALFSPEHGFAGTADVAHIADSADQSTGLTIYSLYGETRRPTAEMLADVDTLVFDIQDIGARFYTYISTMGESMKAAAELKKQFVVLDRPNPIGGRIITGPMLDSGKESFVGFHSLPVRHAMTVGEIALMLKAELELDLDLQVVQCEGWSRDQVWDETNLTWINPSPNMRCLTQALLYPGIGLLETTNVSVGRGTDTPFEILGAPWMNGPQLANYLRQRQLPGVTFIPIEFTPASSKHAQQKCSGINIVITDRDRYQSVRVGLEIAAALRKLHQSDWDTASFNRLLGNDQVYQSILSMDAPEDTRTIAAEGVKAFERRRAQHLLYR